jgi:hypothetical protein
MLTTLVVLNLLCLAAAAAAVVRLWWPVKPVPPAVSFAAILAAARPVESDPVPPVPVPVPTPLPAIPAGAPMSAAPPSPLPLAARMAAVRHMLQGRSAEETAAAIGASCGAVQALYRLHGRPAEGTC